MFADKISFESEITKILRELNTVRSDKSDKHSKKRMEELLDIETKLEEQYEELCDEYVKFCESM
jgi:hypothetical protein